RTPTGSMCSNMAGSSGRGSRVASRTKPERGICRAGPSSSRYSASVKAISPPGVDENDGDAARDDESDPGEREPVRQRTEDHQSRQHRPNREAIEEGRYRRGPAEPIGEQDARMAESDEQARKGEKGEMPAGRRPPAL